LKSFFKTFQPTSFSVSAVVNTAVVNTEDALGLVDRLRSEAER
jgi:hypothetical protein